jgi:hypothetical protein
MQDRLLPGRSLSEEERFFARHEAQQRARLRAARERAEARAALRAGIDDPAALDALLELGLTRETLPAIEWAPLVAVAWADGAVDPAERRELLEAAEEDGLPPRHPAHRTLAAWLATRPGPQLERAWRLWLAATARDEPEEVHADREAWLSRRLREIASVSGGWLGFARTSRDEDAAIERLERAARHARAA